MNIVYGKREQSSQSQSRWLGLHNYEYCKFTYLELNEWYELVHVISISKSRLERAVAEVTRGNNVFIAVQGQN